MIDAVLLAESGAARTAVNADIDQRPEHNVNPEKFDDRHNVVDVVGDVNLVVALE